MGAGRGHKQRTQSRAGGLLAGHEYAAGEQSFNVDSYEELAALLPASGRGNSLVITVGVPGSGKSHWARAFAAANGYEVVETDAIRKEVTGSFGDQSENTRVFDIFYDTVGETLARGANVVADSTGIHGGIRSRLCEAAEVAGSANAGVHVVCFDNQHQSGWRNLKRIGRKHVPRRAQRKFRLSLARSKAALVADEAAGYASVFFVQDYSGSSTRGKFIVSDKV